ncbi:hypothetical protein IFM89_033044 [Coptis chinensis]|uniref:Uncharacterized protein n=1 Tax=Coptis chinensis TaxID=261450 RepID=A0A835M7V5_9MAGN|nr:hypothetical protein IFM89_033044 [Coptis chinensis]
MATSLVDVKEKVLVFPSEPTPLKTLPLSTLDSNPLMRFDVKYLFVYRSNPGLNRNAIVAGIKNALARALVPYYPLAGRVRVGPDGKNLEVVCESQGAMFIEGVSKDITIADLEHAPSHCLQWRDFLTKPVDDDVVCEDGAPPLVVQLTWLANGEGAAIGVGTSHCLMDGIGTAQFLNSFADLASGRREPDNFQPKSVWDCHLLDPTQMSLHTRNLEFNLIPDISGFFATFGSETMSPTSVVFDKTRLTKLKKLASLTGQHSELPFSFTSFEVLTAHVWRSWARSLDLPSEQILRMLFTVNIRNRLKPSLPEGYYGNGFVLTRAQATVKDLSDNDLGHTAGLIKNAKDNVGDEYVRSLIQSISESRQTTNSVGLFMVSQWSRLGLEKVDFGMGKPVHVGPICRERYCLFLPVYEQSDSVMVAVAMPNSAVAKYEYLLKV